MLKRYGFLVVVSALITIPAQAAATFAASLTASPSNTTSVGHPITLTAAVSMIGGGTLAPELNKRTLESLNYKYEAQRVWPAGCAETIAIAGNGPTTTWNPPSTKAGDYKLVVTVRRQALLGQPQFDPISSKIDYVVRNVGIGGVGPVTITPTATSSPVTSISVSAGVSPPGNGPFTYRWKLLCSPYTTTGQCNLGTNSTVEGTQNPRSWPNITVVRPVGLKFNVDVDVINQATCSLNSWLGIGEMSLP